MKSRIALRISDILEFNKLLYYRYIKKLHYPHLIYNLSGQKIINNLFGQPKGNYKFKTIIDVGASDGNFIKSSRYLNKDAKIYAFEPQPWLMDNLNKLNNNNFNVALGDKTEIKDFYIRKSHRDSSSLYDLKSYYRNEDINKIQVQIKRGDEINIKYIKPVLLKIDVEGFEYEVLKGFGNKLKEVDIIIIELALENQFKGILKKFSKIVDLLSEYGFTGFLQKEIGYRNNYPDTDMIPGGCDIMFFKNDLSEAIK